MKHSAVNRALNILKQAGLAASETIKGCNEEEIRSLEDRFSVRLPKCYRDFLAVMGYQVGDFLVGTDYSFPKMLEFRKGAEDLMRSSQSDVRLPQSAFVFIFHQGYTFLFFDCNDDPDDPPVFMFTEANKKTSKISDSLSTWLFDAVDDDINAYRELDET